LVFRIIKKFVNMHGHMNLKFVTYEVFANIFLYIKSSQKLANILLIMDKTTCPLHVTFL